MLKKPCGLFSRNPPKSSPETLWCKRDKRQTHAAGISRQEESRMKNTHVLHVWKGHIVDTFPHVRGAASVKLSCLLTCSHPPRCMHTKPKSLWLNVVSLKCIFDHKRRESNGIDYTVHDAKRGDFQDFIWASLLSSIYWIVLAYLASRMVFPHGMSVILCAYIDSWSSSKSHACEEVIGQTRGTVEPHSLSLPPDKEFKETSSFR